MFGAKTPPGGSDKGLETITDPAWTPEDDPTHLVILRQDVVHVRHVLAGDLLDDQRAVVGVQQETFSLVICTPGRGTAGQ